MARLIYVDETGSDGTRGAKQQSYLTLAAVIVPEDEVQPLAAAMRKVASDHLDWPEADFEFHGYELWDGRGCWSEKSPPELLAVYENVIRLLDDLDLYVAHSSIHKANLHERYGGAADGNAYLLALQFLLEKIDQYSGSKKLVIADEAKEHQLRAIKMVADMQQWGAGEVPGMRLRSVIDCLHFVRSNSSPGVQMADLVAYILQRYRRGNVSHPDARAALARMHDLVREHTLTWREPWPPTPRRRA